MDSICLTESSTPSSQNHELFPEKLLSLVRELHHEFNSERLELLKARKRRQKHYDDGELPSYLGESEATTSPWKIARIPEELLCRRVEITGPVNSTKMVINMLSRNEFGERADMAMLDFEDSMKPSWINVLDGYRNVMGAVSGDLSFEGNGKVYRLNPSDMAYVMVRVRGLHLDEPHFMIDKEPVAAGLLDLVVCYYHTAHQYLAQGKTPKYYIPKCEHYLEARWWNRLFTRLETAMGHPVGTLRATFLIETLPATFQVEEILFELRDHAVGLNVGRWDKIFSDIKVLKRHPDRIIADRSTITMDKPWMENYAKRIIKICHSRGAFAMGGMSAFTPGKTLEQREHQTSKVLADKAREASWGHDGCWVSHPYFIGFAMKAFTQKNQLEKTLPDFPKYPDVLPKGQGPYTLDGLRRNLRVGIAYMQGWNNDIGCVAFDDLMEDLATLEISRAQTWQWLHHGVFLKEGQKVTRELVSQTFEEELAKIMLEREAHERQDLTLAMQSAREIFLSSNLPDFLTQGL